MKRLAKASADLLAAVIVAPAYVWYAAGAALVGRDRSFPGLSQFWALVPGTTGVFLRRAIYRWTLAECGADCHMGFGTVISHPTARIRARTYVGAYCVLGDVTLEEDVLLGSHVAIINGNRQHGIKRLDIPIREQPGEYRRVTIGRDSWIGDRSVVMADVGEQSVVGAGSVVTKPIPPRSIAVGNPARVIRRRGEDASASTIDLAGSEGFDDRSAPPPDEHDPETRADLAVKVAR